MSRCEQIVLLALLFRISLLYRKASGRKTSVREGMSNDCVYTSILTFKSDVMRILECKPTRFQ